MMPDHPGLGWFDSGLLALPDFLVLVGPCAAYDVAVIAMPLGGLPRPTRSWPLSAAAAVLLALRPTPPRHRLPRQRFHAGQPSIQLACEYREWDSQRRHPSPQLKHV